MGKNIFNCSAIVLLSIAVSTTVNAANDEDLNAVDSTSDIFGNLIQMTRKERLSALRGSLTGMQDSLDKKKNQEDDFMSGLGDILYKNPVDQSYIDSMNDFVNKLDNAGD